MNKVLTVIIVVVSQQLLSRALTALVSWASIGVLVYSLWKMWQSVAEGAFEHNWWWLPALIIFAFCWILSAGKIATRIRFSESLLDKHGLELGAGTKRKAFEERRLKLQWGSGGMKAPERVRLRVDETPKIRNLVEFHNWLTKILEGRQGIAYALNMSALNDGQVEVFLVEGDENVKQARELISLLKVISSEVSILFTRYGSLYRDHSTGDLSFDSDEVLNDYTLRGIENAAEKALKRNFKVVQEDGTRVDLKSVDAQEKESQTKLEAYLERLWRHVSGQASVYGLRIDTVRTSGSPVNSIAFVFGSDGSIRDDDFEIVNKNIAHNLEKKIGGQWTVTNEVLDSGEIICTRL